MSKTISLDKTEEAETFQYHQDSTRAKYLLLPFLKNTDFPNFI